MIWPVQMAIMSETMILQPIFLRVGILLGLVALFWLRRRASYGAW